jgi:plastocyanin
MFKQIPAPTSAARVLRFFLMLLALPVVVLGQASIEGRVPLPKGSSVSVVNKRYEIVSKGGIVSTNPPLAVVYLEGTFPKPSPAPVAQMVQKDLAFVPMLLPVQVGTKVEFPNQDDTYHNIFSYSAPKRFDLGRYRADEHPVPFQIFDVPGLETLRCDIHEHMRGLILVLDTPYFVLSGTDGVFRLTGLPPGRYTLKAWINSKTTLERPVELRDGSVTQVDFQ